VFFGTFFTAFVALTFIDAPRNMFQLIMMAFVTFVVCLPFLVMMDRKLLRNLLRQIEFWFILFQVAAFTFSHAWQEYEQYRIKCADCTCFSFCMSMMAPFDFIWSIMNDLFFSACVLIAWP
jgi:hypothetical protein